jgi:hypothetical protein
MSAAFSCVLGDFSSTSRNEKLGALISSASERVFATHYTRQTMAWETQLDLLSDCLSELLSIFPNSRTWRVMLEYSIPRRSKRPDIILLADDVIFVLECKVGALLFEAADSWQALSYALDLRDFHAESAGRKIVPILLAISGEAEAILPSLVSDNANILLPVQRWRCTEGAQLAKAIRDLYLQTHVPGSLPIDGEQWESSAYRPSPNIIEAAESLFAGHSVAEISHAFASNLWSTSQTIIQAIDAAEREQRRTICFVTGIPGAGKTLAGLNAVHDPLIRRDNRPSAVFLSGNRPLVNVVREALIRNRVSAGIPRGEAKQAVSAFISYVHGFLETYGIERPTEKPHEHTIIFDEAQRAWNAVAVAKRHGVHKSEAELILDIMRRAPDWSVVVALVGGGQEIHKGEAGLAEWGRALNSCGTAWRVLASGDVIRGGISVTGHHLFLEPPKPHLEIIETQDLHLDVGVRSPRADWLGDWVNWFLASQFLPMEIQSRLRSGEFPMFVTRDLGKAKKWLRERTDGAQRCGLLASSGALRLRADGIEVTSSFRTGYPYADWFLGDRNDCRSSYWLEVAATEFECQGLELDWSGLCWGGDLVFSPKQQKLLTRRFHGKGWLTVRDPTNQQYLLNKYRVLLTRARRGMVIWVPRGDASDPTRPPEEFDATADFLARCGVPLLDD